VVFLSGGMSDVQATSRLHEMNRSERGTHPWQLSFSYGRALQAPCLAAWGGDEANLAVSQAALAHRARMNGLARAGAWHSDLETVAA
jgi:fructose-bisphosphate aldolase class I